MFFEGHKKKEMLKFIGSIKVWDTLVKAQLSQEGPSLNNKAPFQALFSKKVEWCGAVVVAQLAERSLPTPEIRGLNPDIGNILNIFYLSIAIQKRRKIKKKRPGMAHLKKNCSLLFQVHVLGPNVHHDKKILNSTLATTAK